MMLRILFICLSASGGLILSVVVQAQDHENVEQVGRIYNYWHDANDVVVVGDLA